MDTRKKWITVNGVLRKNPAYQQSQVSTVANPNQALAIVSSMNDTEGMALSEATSATIEAIQDQAFLQEFQTSVSSESIVEGLSNVFDQYEIPIGLMNKLIGLAENNLNFIIDDSLSMNSPSDVPFMYASDYIKQKYDPQGTKSQNINNKMTRWQEVEDRLYVLSQIIKYIPVHQVTISFLNRSDRIVIDHRGKPVETFGSEIVKAFDPIFNRLPKRGDNTPLYKKVYAEFSMPRMGRTRHYIMTDGEPNDCSNEQFTDLIVFRGLRPTGNFEQLYQAAEQRGYDNPVGLLSCTNGDARLLKRIEGIALYCSENDDFKSEQKEVLEAQGDDFPYSRGSDLISQLAASDDPNLLDALDESVLTKGSLDNYLGRVTSNEEYTQYFDHCPKSKEVPLDKKALFWRTDLQAKDILPLQKKNILQQYLNEHPNVQPPMGVINSLAATSNHYADTYTNAYQTTQQNQWQASTPSSQTTYYSTQQNPRPLTSQPMPANFGYSSTQNQSPYHPQSTEHLPPYNPQWMAQSSQPTTNNFSGQNVQHMTQPGMQPSAPPQSNNWQSQQSYYNNPHSMFGSSNRPQNPQPPSSNNQQSYTPRRGW